MGNLQIRSFSIPYACRELSALDWHHFDGGIQELAHPTTYSILMLYEGSEEDTGVLYKNLVTLLPSRE